MSASIVSVSQDFGATWVSTAASSQFGVVISPGAGTYANRHAFRALQATGVTLTFIDTADRDQGFRYPKGWGDNEKLVLTPGRKPTDLLGLANKMQDVLATQTPGFIICGSRGGQVTIGLIWRHYWRGPTVMINAGCLMTNTRIPKEVSPVFITMGNDYFPTRSLAYVADKFKELAEASSGQNIFAPSQSHMPLLTNDLLRLAIGLAVGDTASLPGVPPTHSVYKLAGEPPAWHPIVQSNKGLDHVLLRRKCSKAATKRSWVPGGRLENGTRVEVLKCCNDEDGYQMLFVRTPSEDDENARLEGWIYGINVIDPLEADDESDDDESDDDESDEVDEEEAAELIEEES